MLKKPVQHRAPRSESEWVPSESKNNRGIPRAHGADWQSEKSPDGTWYWQQRSSGWSSSGWHQTEAQAQDHEAIPPQPPTEPPQNAQRPLPATHAPLKTKAWADEACEHKTTSAGVVDYEKLCAKHDVNDLEIEPEGDFDVAYQAATTVERDGSHRKCEWRAEVAQTAMTAIKNTTDHDREEDNQSENSKAEELIKLGSDGLPTRFGTGGWHLVAHQVWEKDEPANVNVVGPVRMTSFCDANPSPDDQLLGIGPLVPPRRARGS